MFNRRGLFSAQSERFAQADHQAASCGGPSEPGSAPVFTAEWKKHVCDDQQDRRQSLHLCVCVCVCVSSCEINIMRVVALIR